MKCQHHPEIELEDCTADGTDEVCLVCDVCIKEWELRRWK